MAKRLIPILAVVGVQTFSQTADTRPQFEVISIRRCVGPQPPGSLSASPGRLRAPCVGLLRLIQDAYQIFADGTANFMMQPPSPTPIKGFVDAMDSDRYTVEAKAESPQSLGMMRGPMMQRLLEDRFHLKIHRETRQAPVYLLTVAKDGPKLLATAESSCIPPDPTGFSQLVASVTPDREPQCGVLRPPTRHGTHFALDERGITIATFSRLIKIGGLPVVDRTGLSGKFDIRLEWDVSPPDKDSPDGGASDPPDMSIVSSIRKQLGLQLDSGKGPQEFLVIDRLERPSEN